MQNLKTNAELGKTKNRAAHAEETWSFLEETSALVTYERDILLASIQELRNFISLISQERMELKASKRELESKNRDLCDELKSTMPT